VVKFLFAEGDASDTYRHCAINHHCSLDDLAGGKVNRAIQSSLRRTVISAANLDRRLRRGDEMSDEATINIRTITMLRDPVDRVISEFRHVCAQLNTDAAHAGAWDYSTHLYRVNRTSPQTGRLACDEAALRAFVDADAHANGMRNRMVRMIGGGGHSGVDGGDRELVSKAKKALDAMDAVLLLEHFDLSLALLSAAFLVDPPKTYSIVREELEEDHGMVVSETTRELVRNANLLDTELYQYAMEIMQQRLGKLFAEEAKNDGLLPGANCVAYACGTNFWGRVRKNARYYSDSTCVANFHSRDADACCLVSRINE
jgi:hypothetical protein